MASKRIAFIRRGRVPLASERVAQALRNNFPEYEVETIDITQLVKENKDILLTNTFFTVKEYGFEVLLGKKRFKDAFFRTTYLFHKVKALMSAHLSRHAYAFSFQMQSLFDASLPGLPHFIYTDHTNLANLQYSEADRGRIYSKTWLQLEKKIYDNAALVFTRSSNITRSVIEQYGCRPDKVVCVYAGSNARVSSFNPGQKDYGNKNILFVGIDWNRKGGPELVEAFKMVLKVYPDARLTIVGCSPPLKVPNCEVVGRVPLQQVGQYYQKASIFCLPTRLEPFGIAFVEALSYSLPIVATDVGAIPDFVINGKNGYLVQPDDIPALAQALIELTGDPQKCQSFGAAGRKIAGERYTWESVGFLLKQHITAAIGQPETMTAAWWEG